MTTAKRPPLARRQREVYEHLAGYIALHGYPPTLRDQAEALGINISAVHQHWQALERKGYVTKNPKMPRTIRLVEVPHAV